MVTGEMSETLAKLTDEEGNVLVIGLEIDLVIMQVVIDEQSHRGTSADLLIEVLVLNVLGLTHRPDGQQILVAKIMTDPSTAVEHQVMDASPVIWLRQDYPQTVGLPVQNAHHK